MNLLSVDVIRLIIIQMDVRLNHRGILLLRLVSVRFNAAIQTCRALWFHRLGIYGPFVIGPESEHRMHVMLLPHRECEETCAIKSHYYPKTLVPKYTHEGTPDVNPYKKHIKHVRDTYLRYLTRRRDDQVVILKKIQDKISQLTGKIKLLHKDK